jgi:uncharacterized protein YbjT (DUF2867 family)
VDVAILGGTGLLGRHLSSRLAGEGHRVTVTGRSVTDEPSPGVRGVAVDLVTGGGLADAVGPADHVVHLASDYLDPTRVDVEGTARLLEIIGDRHLIYVSIVGVDRHPLPYYRSKLAAERLITAAGARHTIVRATQFHDLIANRIEKMTRPPVGILPGRFVFQPIDVAEVADALVGVVERGPEGVAPDLAGPEVLGIRDLARAFLAATGRSKPLLEVPSPGQTARAFRAGLHTNRERAVGTITWAEYLDRRFGS